MHSELVYEMIESMRLAEINRCKLVNTDAT